MTVAPLIAMKSTKCESLEAVGKELDRRAHTYANDVDQSGRHVGYLCRAGDESPVPLEQAIERRMGELNTKRKIRDNQVRAMGFRRLEVAIEDLARKLAPRSARMTTRALKRDLAALERDYVEDDDRSPKARAAEAQRAARGLNANRGDEAPRRSWGQSR